MLRCWYRMAGGIRGSVVIKAVVITVSSDVYSDSRSCMHGCFTLFTLLAICAILDLLAHHLVTQLTGVYSLKFIVTETVASFSSTTTDAEPPGPASSVKRHTRLRTDIPKCSTGFVIVYHLRQCGRLMGLWECNSVISRDLGVL